PVGEANSTGKNAQLTTIIGPGFGRIDPFYLENGHKSGYCFSLRQAARSIQIKIQFDNPCLFHII
ncbi:MAG TPA: hypothetical protein VGD99_13455, partial [Anaerolineae bacterium]